MLRGPQTPGELKQRTERLHPFADLAAIEDTLLGLIDRELVRALERRPGQKEQRYQQLLGGEPTEDAPAAAARRPPRSRTASGGWRPRWPRLRRELDALKAELGAVTRPPAAPLGGGAPDPERHRARAVLRPGLRLRDHPGLAPAARAPDLGGRGPVGADAAGRLVVVELHDLADQRARPRRRSPVRLLMIALMLASLLMAIAIPEAFGDRALLFAGAYVAIQVGRTAFLTFVARPRRHARARRGPASILIWFVAAGVFWIAGALADGPRARCCG